MCLKGQATTLDHFLPQDLYPEFSIFALNLIPACAICNNIKRTLLGTDATGRFIHAYLDDLPTDVPLYEAEIRVESSISAVYSVNRRLPQEIFRNTAYHFEKLSLGELYGLGAADELWNEGDVFVEAHHSGGKAKVRREALRLAERRRTKWGIHSWRAALFDGLAKSEDFCEMGCLLITDEYP
jgi:hypothetical protein